jgi:hypothetical protein
MFAEEGIFFTSLRLHLLFFSFSFCLFFPSLHQEAGYSQFDLFPSPDNETGITDGTVNGRKRSSSASILVTQIGEGNANEPTNAVSSDPRRVTIAENGNQHYYNNKNNNNNGDNKTLEANHLPYQFDPTVFDNSEKSDINSASDSTQDDGDTGGSSDSSDSETDEIMNLPLMTPQKLTTEQWEAYHDSSFYEKCIYSPFMRRASLWFASISALLKIKVYRNLLGAMTALYFTVTGVQYWGTKYLMISLNAPIEIINLLFVLVAATGPTSGVIFGGWLIDSFGGYKGSKQRVVALEMVTVLGLLGFLFSLPITFLSNIYYVTICMWALLFFGASILPACSGILVSMVPRSHRTTSSSLSLVIFNMFGYFLSLILSGFLMEVSFPRCCSFFSFIF